MKREKFLKVAILGAVFCTSRGDGEQDVVVQEWLDKIESAMRLEFFKSTMSDVLDLMGSPVDTITSDVGLRDGEIQYVYQNETGHPLPPGRPPAIRFRFDRDNKLIELSMGIIFGPPVE